MARIFARYVFPSLIALLGACSGGTEQSPADMALEPEPPSSSSIKHVVIVVQENHTFDDHFGLYCTAAAGSNPTCTDGPACCEAAPSSEPSGASPVSLTDAEMAAFNPDHSMACEVDEIDGGKMDRFVTSTYCGSAHNFAVAPSDVMATYWGYARGGAIADRYFQPLVGQSSANDMYLARAAWVFDDNQYGPNDPTGQCSVQTHKKDFTEPTIFDLLAAKDVGLAWYGEGYQRMRDSLATDGRCPDPPDECPAGTLFYPCNFDGGDVPFLYYPTFRAQPDAMRDFARFGTDLSSGKLPPVVFIKGLGFRSEHPGLKTKLSDGVAFVKGVVDAVGASRYAASTLVLVTYDEGGGYFDHVAPPANSTVDGKAYGTRVPLIAVGPFARKNHVSHATLEHSSLVKFIEWNWLDGKTGQLGTRDAVVGNIGSLLDPAATGTAVPE